MKIGIVTTWFERGAAYVSRQYADSLKRQGHSVIIYARGGESQAFDDPRWNTDSVTWARPSMLSDVSGINMKHFYNWLNTEKPDCVLFNEQHSWKPVLACREKNIPTAAYIDYYKKDTVTLFDCFDGLLCNTRRHHSVFSWHANCRYIPWGTNIDLFAQTHKTNSVVSGITTFFHSAGMNPFRKGTDLAIRAFAEIKLPAQLIIHTQTRIQGLFPELESVIDTLVSDKRLTIIHETVPAPGLYHMGDVYVYPARLDGIGLTICEALASGLPAIVPDEPPMNEFVEDMVSGFLIPVERRWERSDHYYWDQCEIKVDALTECMIHVCTHPDNLAAIKQVAHDKAARDYRWKDRDQDISDFFEKLQMHTPQTAPSPGWKESLVYRWLYNIRQRLRRSKARDNRPR